MCSIVVLIFCALCVIDASLGPKKIEAATATPSDGLSIDDVCERQAKPDGLQQLDSVSTYRLGPLQGCELVKLAVDNVKTIVAANNEQTLCRPETGDQINSLELPRKEAGGRSYAKLMPPNGLGVFYEALAFDISAKCKVDLIGQVARLDELLDARELQLVDRLEASSGLIFGWSFELNDLKALDPIQVTAKILKMVYRGASNLELRELQLSADGSKAMRDLRLACERVYRPLYKQVLHTPLVLAEWSRDYALDGPLIGSQNKYKLQNNKRLARWLNLVVACEALQLSGLFLGAGLGRPWKAKRVSPKALTSPQLTDRLAVSATGSDINKLKQLAMSAEGDQISWIARVYSKLDNNGDKNAPKWEPNDLKLDKKFVINLMKNIHDLLKN